MYPTQEQAAAAAMAACAPGDSVFLHTDDCATENDEGCTCDLVEVCLTPDGWRELPKARAEA